MVRFMTFLTDFADQAVILPVLVTVALVLAAQGRRRSGLLWIFVVGATFGTVLAAKIGFLACAPVFGPWDMRGPSGHTAAAAVVAGGLIALLTRRQDLPMAAAALAGVVIGLSRVVLGFHSVPEVILGFCLGLAGAAALTRFAGPMPRRRPVFLLVAVSAVAIVAHGARLPAEAAIWQASLGVLDFVPACRSGQSANPP